MMPTESDRAMWCVAAALREIQAPYLIVGAVSGNVYGVAGATQNMDLVLEVSPAALEQLIRSLEANFEVDPQPSFETVTGTYRNVLHARDFLFDVELFQLSSDAHDQARFQRRVEVDYPQLGGRFSIPTLEDVIITKLRWARGKDLEDVRDVIAVQGEAALDWIYLDRWTAEHGTGARLEAIRASIPPLD